MKKRSGVLILTPFYEPNIGGVETHLKDLTDYLSGSDKYTVYVLTYQPITTKAKGAYFERFGNIYIIRIPWVGFNLFHKLEPYPVLEFLYITPWLFLWTFIFLLFKGKCINVIHAHGFNASFITRLLVKVFNKRFIASTHTIYTMDENSLMARMVRWTLDSANRILALAEASKRELVKIGLNPEGIETYTYWVNQEIFKPIEKDEAKKKIGWEKMFVVLFVGRFIEVKGVDILIEVAKDMDKDIYFAFAGDGPMSASIKKASESLGNVMFLGKISNLSLPIYYSAADILCVPSKYREGVSRVILEALSCGTPVVASNRGGIPEAIDDTVGILIEPTVDNLRREIESLYQMPERLLKMQGQCREYAITRFSKKNAESIVRAYGD